MSGTRERLDAALVRLKRLRQPIYRNAFVLMLTFGLSGVFGFAFWLTAARFYPAEAVGFSASILSLAGFLGSLSSLGLGLGLIRYLPSSRNQRGVIATTLVLVAVVALGIGLVFLGLGPFFPMVFIGAAAWPLAALLLAFTVGFAVTHVVDGSLLAARDTRLVLYRTLLYDSLKLGLLVVVVASLQALGILVSLGMALFVALAAALTLFLPRHYPVLLNSGSVALSKLRPILRYSIGNHVANLLYAMPTGLIPLLVLLVLSASSAARLYVPWILASFLFLAPAAASASLFIEGSHSTRALQRDTVRSLRLSLLLLIPGVAVLFLGGPFLLGLFGAEYSEQGLGLLRILALSAFFVALNSTYIAFLRIARRIKELVVLSGILGGGTLAGSYVLLLSQGILGPGIAFFVTHAAVSSYIVMRHLHRFELVTEGLMRV